jgi:hypothetical protein
MPSTHDKYKSLRNLIRNIEFEESLYICWCFVNYLRYDKPLPTNIELDQKVKRSTEKMIFKLFVAAEWDLEFLVQEIILESPIRIIEKKKSLREYVYRNKVINEIRTLQDFSITSKLSNESIFLELNRISHRQFVWQSHQNLSLFYRYYKIFSYGKLSSLVEKATGFSPNKLFLVGLAFTSYFTSYFTIPYPPGNNINFIDKELQKKFIDYYSLKLKEMKEQIGQSRKYDDTLFYTFNPFRRYPLLKLENKIICPIPVLLYWQITSGTYYSICTEKDFDSDFGFAFQAYVESILNKVNENKKLTIYPETKYGKSEKSTSDIIFEDEKARVFIECKTKRMIMGSRTNINYSVDHERDIEVLASGITQLYKTIEEYKDNKYPNLKYDNRKTIYPILVTLEDWFINYNDKLITALNDKLHEKFATESLNVALLEYQPYHIRSCEEFEEDIQVMSSIGISEYFNIYKNEKGRDAFKDFMFKPIFSEECKSTFLLKEDKFIK